MTLLTPAEQTKINQGSIDTANRGNLLSRYASGQDSGVANPNGNGNLPIVNPNPVPGFTPTSTASPVLSTSESPLQKATREYYEGLSKTVDPEAIRENVRKNMQGQIDATLAASDALIAKDREVGNGLNARVRGINISSGLGGSDFAAANAVGQEKKNQEVIDSDLKQRSAQLAQILGNIDTRASAEIDKATATAKENSKDYLAYLQDKQDKAKTDLTSTAALGIGYDQLKTENPDALTKLLTQTGLSEQQARALFIANAPQGTYLNADKPQIVGNTAVFFKQTKDPVTGKTVISQESIALPAGTDEKNTEIVTRTDGIYIINKIPNADGSYTTKKVGAPNPTTPPSVAKITISEAKSSGLPLSVVGQSEADVVKSLSIQTIPQWFTDKSKTEGVAPTQALWDTYRKAVADTFGTGGGA